MALPTGRPRYEVFGPFPFYQREEDSFRTALKDFWAELERNVDHKDLGSAIGIYVWTRFENGKQVPWNVGLTDRQGFKKRFVQKELGFLRMKDRANLKIEVYLLALRSKTDQFKRPTKAGTVPANSWLEQMLIGAALTVNPNLGNKSKTKYLKNAVVDGYLNDNEEERNKSARSFSALFKARPRKRN